MLANDLLSMKDELDKEGVVFCYFGFITEDVLASIGSAIRDQLAIESVDRKVSRALFAIFVEQVQNVIRYSVEEESDTTVDPALELHYGVLAVGQSEQGFFVTCANMINQKDVDRLRQNLTEIQNMNKDELKAAYKTKLRGDPPEGSKGAGVGLIDIARRASNGFDFEFKPVDDDRTYFALRAYV